MSEAGSPRPASEVERLLYDLLLPRDRSELPDPRLAYDWGDGEPFALAVGEPECDNSTVLRIGREAPFSHPTEPWEMDSQTLAQLLERSEVVVLDVRTPEEYARDHIPQARWVDWEQLGACLDRLGEDVLVVLVCRSGTRSGAAALACHQRGYRNVRHVCGGMLAWTGPTVAGWPELPQE